MDYDRAEKLIRFTEDCVHHWKGAKAGELFILEPHQRFYFINTHGWMLDDKRRFTTSYKQVARKNGKTSEEAIKAIYHISLSGESGPQAWCAANKEEQAKILINDAANFIEASPYLKNQFKIYYAYEKATRVIFEPTKGFIRPLGRDSNKNFDGFDPSLGVVDEYHQAKDDGLLNTIESGQGARQEPLLDIITTAGFNVHGPCYRLRNTCENILRGNLQDDRTFAMIFEIDKDDDWRDPEVWVKPNPNYGVSVYENYMHDRVQKAINEAGSKEVDFKTKNLNIWGGASETWISAESWDECERTPPDLTHKVCWAGLWLAGIKSASAFVMLFETGDVVVKYWASRDMSFGTGSEDVNFKDWIRQGFVSVEEGNFVSPASIINDVKRYISEYRIKQIGVATNSITNAVVTSLVEDGAPIESVSQNYGNLHTPTSEFERLVATQGIYHSGNPLLAFELSVTEIMRSPEDAIKIDKASTVMTVSGMNALINALYLKMQVTEQKKVSVYERRGIQTIGGK